MVDCNGSHQILDPIYDLNESDTATNEVTDFVSNSWKEFDKQK